VTYGVTEDFLIHFGLDDIKDLPGFDEMKAAGLLSTEPGGIFKDLARPEEEGDITPDPEEEEI
jgi:segregation and condensation protein B